MTLQILTLIIGIVLIIAGGNYVTNGAVAVARRYHVSPLIIGMTIVAIGSSTPDFVVSMFATVAGKSTMAVGNILGAVIFDMLLIIGVMAIIKPIVINRVTLWVNIPVMVLGAIIVFLCAESHLIDKTGADDITRTEGLTLMMVFILFMIYTLRTSHGQHQSPAKAAAETPADPQVRMWLAIVMIVGGLAALVIGGRWIVSSASDIARHFGMSEALIGLTVVGIGSSLPDFATSIVAAVKGQSDIALGNVIGSCIIDILFVLGACAIVHPLSIAGISIADFATLAGASVLVLLAAAKGGVRRITRPEGVILTLAYVGYIAWLIASH